MNLAKLCVEVVDSVEAETGGAGPEWEDFKLQKKNRSPKYLGMIIAATPIKEGGGRGKKGGEFQWMQYLQETKSHARVKTGSKKAFKTLVGFSNHCMTEFGWSAARSKSEWDFLREKASSEDLKKTRDRISGLDIEWMRIDMEDYAVAENEEETSNVIVLACAQKKKPSLADLVCTHVLGLLILAGCLYPSEAKDDKTTSV